MGIDPKARKKCEWCGRKMGPRYFPNASRYESQRWERPAAFAKRRFCSRSCQGLFLTRRVLYPANEPRNREIMRLRGLGWTTERIAGRLGVSCGAVIGVVHRSTAKPRAARKPGPPA